MLSIRLLGAPEVLLDGRPIHVTRRKSRALIYYLAAHSKPLRRDHLLTFFWPDLDRASAQQTLRTTLHGLRKALGAALLVDDETLALSPDIEVDVHTVESRLQLPTSNLHPPTSNLQFLASTLDLYRGDFLADFELPDAPQFDDWASIERERYRRLAVRGLAALSRQHEADRDYAAALDAIDRAIAFDPLQEDIQRIGLRLCYLAGDRAGAIRRYESLRKLLDEELGVPPMAETRVLYDAIIKDEGGTLRVKAEVARLTQTVAPSPPIHPSSLIPLPFMARVAELQILHSVAASRKLALIEGEPGIGKTRLAEEFIRASNGAVLVGTARELEQALPYQPVIEALRSLTARADWPTLRAGLRADVSAVWLTEVARLLPELADPSAASQSSPPSADESRLWEGLHQFLVALARRQPIILFVDDAHWADASTLAVLGYLVRRSQNAGVAVVYVVAARSAASRSPLAALTQALTREGWLERVTLSRLTRDDTLALAARLSPDFAHPLADWLMQNAEGNPYILAELIRHARANDILQPDGTLNLSSISAAPVVPRPVYTLIQSRLARLSDAARRVVDAGVAVGREFEFDVVARAAALSDGSALDAIDDLRAAGLISPTSAGAQRFVFDHSLTMEVAYREVGEPRHRRLHRRVAETMESIYRNRIDAVAGLIASHFAEGEMPDRAAPYALRAAQQAARLAAWQEAINFYTLALTGTAERERGPIYMELGSVRMRAGQFARASEDLRAALALIDPQSREASEAHLAFCQALASQARYAEAIAHAQHVLATGAPQDAMRAELLWGMALSLEGADLIGAAEHLNAAAALAGDSPDLIRAHVKFELGSVAAMQGDLPRAVGLYRESLAIARQQAAPDALTRQILAHNNLAYHLHLMGDASAAQHAQDGLRLAQEHGELGVQTYLLSTLGEIALAHGDLDVAEARFSEGLTLAESFAAQERIAGLTANLGLVARARSQSALAIHRLSSALTRADTLGTQHLAIQIRLWLVPLLPPAEARALLAEARAMAQTSGRRRLLDEAVRLEAQLPPA